MNDRAILKKYGYDKESTSIKEMEIEVGNMLKDARQDEREKILNFIGKLKISDEFHEFWKNEVMSTGEDVLRNTLDMVIREIKEMR